MFTEIILEDGKYRVYGENGVLHADRHKCEWRDLAGDKLILAMVHEIERLNDLVDSLRGEVRQLENREYQ